MPATKTRRKRCSECGELKHEVLGKQRLCEDCEEGKSYCTICDEWVDRAWGGGCRHVGWNDALGCECGCGADSGIDADDHKKSFGELLKRFSPLKDDEGNPLVPRLLRQIESNNFWTCWHGPLIGSPPDLGLMHKRQFPTHTSCWGFRDIRCSEQEAWGSEAIDAMQLGMAWLTSLDSESAEANKITAGWIREFLSTEPT